MKNNRLIKKIILELEKFEKVNRLKSVKGYGAGHAYTQRRPNMGIGLSNYKKKEIRGLLVPVDL